MATFIGKPISLISHSDVRYRGILAGIDPNASTIQLSNVFSMGTESRRPPNQYIPPVQDPYEYIIFRASEVKDLAVDESAPQRSVHDDPAVLGASAPTQAAPGYAAQYGGAPGYAPAAGAPLQRAPLAPAAAPAAPAQTTQPSYASRTASSDVRPGSVQTADASLETVGRALNDARQRNSTNTGSNGNKVRVPAQDFDFAGSNARFDKAALSPSPSGVTEGSEEAEQNKAYDPQRSFFDSLSSGSGANNSNGPTGGGRGGRGGGSGRGGRGSGRNRREEERERNVATFGEPGGVGLMGPGAYVGGWGGYGRRGGGRGRRGQAVGSR